MDVVVCFTKAHHAVEMGGRRAHREILRNNDSTSNTWYGIAVNKSDSYETYGSFID